LFELEQQLTHLNPANVAITRQIRQCSEDRRRDVYDSHRHRIFSLAFYMTGNELEAEAILASTFVKAFTAAEDPGAVTVDHALLEELRQRFSLTPGDPVSPAEVMKQAGMEGRNVRRTDLEESVKTLPPLERLLFLLRDVEGYEPSAIAALVQMPEAQVQRSLFSARLRLRNALVEAHAKREAEAV
jgi:DNA-directed RNA polymerase specialized sigma24 family protein